MIYSSFYCFIYSYVCLSERMLKSVFIVLHSIPYSLFHVYKVIINLKRHIIGYAEETFQYHQHPWPDNAPPNLHMYEPRRGPLRTRLGQDSERKVI